MLPVRPRVFAPEEILKPAAVQPKMKKKRFVPSVLDEDEKNTYSFSVNSIGNQGMKLERF